MHPRKERVGLILNIFANRLRSSAVRFKRVSKHVTRQGGYSGYSGSGYSGYGVYGVYQDTPVGPINPPRRPHEPVWERRGSSRGGGRIGGVVDIHNAIEIDETLLVLQASGYPFRINLSDRVQGIVGEERINVLSVTEVTQSVLQTDFEGSLVRENPFFLDYKPQGNFLSNTLKIKFEASDSLRVATAAAIRAGNPYASPSVPPTIISPPSEPPTEGELCVQVINDVIGDPEKEKEYWNDQGNNGTCLIASVGSILESQGVATFEEVLRKATIGVNSAGVYVVLDENQNPVLDRNGQWLLYGTRGYDNSTPDILRIDGQFAYVKFLDTPGQTYQKLIADVYGGTIPPELAEVLTKGTIYPNPLLKQNWGWVEQFFDAYNVESHTGYASNFVEIIEELSAGNGIVAYIDAIELWNSKPDSLRTRITRFILDTFTGGLEHPRSVQNHAVWLTGIDVSDPDNPMIIINDSGDREDMEGAGIRYPLKDFAAAFEDAEFVYQATGPPPNPTLQTQRDTLINELHTFFINNPQDNDSPCVTRTTERFNQFIRKDSLINRISLDRVSRDVPGFRERVEAYKTAVEQNRVRVLEAVGLDPDEIKKIFEEVDVE